MSAEQKAIAIADKIVPAFRARRTSHSDHLDVAKAWRAAHDGALAVLTTSEPFQARVQPWLTACFGEMIAGDRDERNHRFLEEALELIQACGCSASEAHQLVDYVFGREAGDPPQEVGGVMVTLAALCLANGLDMHANAETELARIWTKVEAIRAKQAAKPKHSPLPEALESTPALYDVLRPALDDYVEFAGEVAGTSLGLAMSTEHPAPDQALMGMFEKSQALATKHRAVIAGRKAFAGED